MIIRVIEGYTRALGAPKDWDPDRDGYCGTLPIIDMRNDQNLPVMISAWEPTPREIEAMQAGAAVYLQVVGMGHPPVWMWVGDKPPSNWHRDTLTGCMMDLRTSLEVVAAAPNQSPGVEALLAASKRLYELLGGAPTDDLTRKTS